jgi:alpha-mannosidase
MKELHLICNAHLDPVWQWDWNEGATAALATFYSAVDIADEYDYIFCHNEALLYEYVEQYDPELFKRIQELVKAGKWHIMGGWYVQPDCNIPSGEGFVRQIESGLTYFKEKFGERPTVAVNFDSFGHTQGLVQILNKCGYEGYIFCRPMDWIFDLPKMVFNWIGLDGSTVKGARFQDATIYCSELGNSVNAIKRKMQPWENEEIAFALWGVGNHGGGASRQDLTDIKAFAEEQKANGVAIFHSTPEAFFGKVAPDVDYNAALQPCFIKCYSSIARLKRKYAELENKLLKTEKICAYADREGIYNYNLDAFSEAQKQMAAMQFHDVLSGTCIIEGEKSSLQKAEYALELLDKEFAKAFMALCKDYDKATPGDYPIFVYNPNPYKVEQIFNGEFFLLDGICSDTEGYEFIVRKDGEEVPFQVVKESSCINLDRSKRLAIKTELNPLSITRFDVEIRKGAKKFLDRSLVTEYENNVGAKMNFTEESGSLTSYVVDGQEYLNGNAFTPVVFDDNADPWGWHMKSLGSNYQKVAPKTSLRVVEKGDLLTRIESIYDTGKSDIRVAYTLYKDFNYIDVTVNVYWNDEGKGLKLEIPVKEIGRFLGQTSFGTQVYGQGTEECSHRFVGVEMGDKILTVFKDGTYGCSVEDGKLYITLLNGSVYCAHPVGELPIIDDKRFNYYIDLGRHEFTFRLEVCKEEELEKKAAAFTQPVYALNFYPHGKGNKKEEAPVTLSNENVSLSALRKVADDVYMVRLINNYKEGVDCACTVFGQTLNLSFGKYEVKTLIFKDGELKEQTSMLYL